MESWLGRYVRVGGSEARRTERYGLGPGWCEWFWLTLPFLIPCILCVSFGNWVTFPSTSLIFLMEVLVKDLGFSKVLQLYKTNIYWQRLQVNKALEWKAEPIQTWEIGSRPAPIRWQFGSMCCSIRNVSLIFWVLLPPYALLFSIVVTSDLPWSLVYKISFTAVELNCCQKKRIHSMCQCQSPLVSHITESRNSLCSGLWSFTTEANSTISH